MEQAEFDRYADDYDTNLRQVVQVTGEQPDYFAEYKIRVTANVLAAKNFSVRKLLDFGSGIGNSIPHFKSYFPDAQLTCADVSFRSLEQGERLYPDTSTSLLIDSDRIPAEDSSFDLAFSACVFHHVDHDKHVHWLRELHRITRPGGFLAVFEHNPLNPLTVRAVNSCPFDENARLMRSGQLAQRFKAAGWKDPAVRYHLFLPNKLAPLRRIEPMLTRVPFGAQYSVIAHRKE